MKIGFFGTPEHSRNLLELMLKENLEITFVVTNPDKPRGRGNILTPTPVKQFAIANSLPVFEPNFKSNTGLDFLEISNVDLYIVYAYGSILPETVFQKPKFGMWNLHGSLLPKYRGASPVQSALANSEIFTGFTWQYVDKELDRGDILALGEIPISATDNSETLLDAITTKGFVSLLELLKKLELEKTKLVGTPQNHELATYCKKWKKEDKILSWKDGVSAIHGKVQALYSDGGAITSYRNQNILLEKTLPFGPESNLEPGSLFLENKKLYAVCGDGKSLEIISLKREGKNSMKSFDFWNGIRLHPGNKFV